jgi:hypothetical protein
MDPDQDWNEIYNERNSTALLLWNHLTDKNGN